MKIAMVGTGALGSFYGTKLQLAGNDVHFLLRSDYEAAMREGIRVTQEGESLHAYPITGYTDPAAIGICDLVVVTAKSTANETLPQQIVPLVGPRTAVLVLQNGLGNVERFQTVLGEKNVLGGLCFVAATRVQPAQVEVYFTGSIRIAEPSSPPLGRTEKIATLFKQAGIPCETAESFDLIVWKKLVWNIPFSGLAVAANTTTDVIMADDALRAQAHALMEEVRAAAQARGLAIDENFLHSQMDSTLKLGAYAPSALIDYRKGRALEVDSIWGEPLRRAEQAGVQTPRLSLLTALLKRLSANKGGC